MSALASVRKISAINPIPNADAIEVAKIDGWEVVVKKGEFKEGDLCVYFQIDSLLPIKPQFAFLKDVKKMGDVEGYRLRTIKLRGQVSQGLALPLSEFELGHMNTDDEGTDVSDFIGVLKYEKPIPAQLRGQMKGYLPSFLRKTDEERIQNISEDELDSLMLCDFVQTLKRDGSSMTAFCVKEMVDVQINEIEVEQQPVWRFGVCSRNLELKENEDNAFWAAANALQLGSILMKLCSMNNRSLALQGELYGEGIQSNPHKIRGTKFEVFNIWDIDNQEYLAPCQVWDLLAAIEEGFGVTIPYVPVSPMGVKPLEEFGKCHDDFLKLADEAYKHHDGGFNEGHVYKSAHFIEGKIYSFKVVSNQYLLKVEQ